MTDQARPSIEVEQLDVALSSDRERVFITLLADKDTARLRLTVARARELWSVLGLLLRAADAPEMPQTRQ